MADQDDFMGGLFDLDGDGQTDIGEEFMAYQLFEEMSNDSSSFSSDVNPYSNVYSQRVRTYATSPVSSSGNADDADEGTTALSDAMSEIEAKENRRKRMKTRGIFIASVIAICMLISGIYKHYENKPYREILTLIDQGKYYEARLAISESGSYTYKNCFLLSYIADAYEKYEEGDIEQAEYNLRMWAMSTKRIKDNNLPADYREKYKAFQAQVQAEAEPIKQARLKEQQAEEQKRREQAQKEWEAAKIRLQNEMPYEGMEERFVSLTCLGNYAYCSDLSKRYGKSYRVYIFKDSKGRETYSVTCQNSVVTKVWNKLGSSKKSTTTKKTESDPYNAKSYSNEEDFYDDYYDEFMDYYEAEDYWRDHQ